MKDQRWISVGNVWPFVTTFFAVALAIFGGRFGFLGKGQVTIPIKIGFVDGPITVRTPTAVRVALVLTALSTLAFGLTRDYSRHFPNTYNLEVFFRDSAVETALAKLTAADHRLLSIDDNWKAEKRRRLTGLRRRVKKLAGVEFPFDTNPGAINSVGTVNFNVNKVGVGQRYEVSRESKGELTHTYETPGSTEKFYSVFQLKPAADRHLEISVGDQLRGAALLRVEYKQLLYLSPTDLHYDQDILAVTKTRFFPWVTVYDTLYLVQSETAGKWIPIGIAKNTMP